MNENRRCSILFHLLVPGGVGAGANVLSFCRFQDAEEFAAALA
jgi:hypothetical protein